MKKLKIHGQTLIELVVSIGFVLIIISAVAILTVNGLKNSQFSRNQIQATKLAQEGIEKIRNLRAQNYTVCGPPVSTISTNGLFLPSGTCPGSQDPTPNQCVYIFKNSGATCIAATPVNDPYFIYFLGNKNNNPSQFEEVTVNGLTFKRVIYLGDSKDINNNATSNVKEVNVVVTWTDSSGTHSSNVSTKLSNI